jgi:hypothetical protein
MAIILSFQKIKLLEGHLSESFYIRINMVIPVFQCRGLEGIILGKEGTDTCCQSRSILDIKGPGT